MNTTATAMPQAHQGAAYAIPLVDIDASNPELYRNNTLCVRRESPRFLTPDLAEEVEVRDVGGVKLS